MKKLVFFALSVVLFTAACTKFKEETAPQFASSVAAPSIEQVADAQHNSDSAFTVKITPAADNNYYTYAIIKGEKSSLDAETLLECGYEKSAVVLKKVVDGSEVEIPLIGCYKASEQKDLTVLAEDLIPNTTYTVYAVACDNMGIVSKVEALEITTSDKIAPTVRYNGKWNFSAAKLEDEMSITLTFDDPVSLSKSAKSMSAKFYASYIAANKTHVDSYGDDECDVIFKEIIPVENISVSGKSVNIKVPTYIPGAAVLISYDAGVVVNGTGIPNDTQNYGGMYYYNDKPTTYGITGRFTTKSWKFTRPMIQDEDGNDVRMPADTVIYFNDWKDFIATAEPEALYGTDKADNRMIVFEKSEAPMVIYTDASMRQISYPASQFGTVSATIYGLCLDEQPDYGAYVMFSIPAGSVEDIWGNPNEAFETSNTDEEGNVQKGNYFFSYGYNVEDLYGTYTLYADTQYAKTYSHEGVVIAPAPADDKDFKNMDVAIYGLFDETPCCDDFDSFNYFGATFGATFNIHNGVLKLGWYDAVGVGTINSYNWNNYVFMLSLDTEDNTFSFQQPKKGTLILQDVISVYCNSLGTWDRYFAGSTGLVKTSDEYTIPSDEEEEGSNTAPARRKVNNPAAPKIMR